MSPVLEIPEALSVRHGPYQGVECPRCSEGETSSPCEDLRVSPSGAAGSRQED